ncbi:MAG: hypothetical protein GX308_03170 [Epulopiscium sp.]|nr:hypothetical protein [Candidatus Epulonipiscium sp.]
MSCFLKLSNQGLVVVDYSPRNGLYYQTFMEEKVSRPNLLLSNGSYEYTALFDENDDFHVIAKNNRNQILHLRQSSDKILKDIVLDDSNNEFKISNLSALALNNQIHLFYYADHPSEQTPELIHHVIKEPLSTPQTLGTLYSRNLNYDLIKHKKTLILTMINKDEQDFSINVNSLGNNKGQWEHLFTPVTSAFPITYCKLTVDAKGLYHLIYIQEQYGQYQLLYKYMNREWSKSELLYSCGYPFQPVFLVYRDSLWINWIENNICKAILSVDGGVSFSAPIHTSMQDSDISLHSLSICHGLESSLICNQLYGISSPIPKFAVLNSMDMDGIHSNISPNTELKLYLNNIKNQLKISVSKTKLEEENATLKEQLEYLNQIQLEITDKYNELADLATKIQDEGKKWRNLYNQSKSEIEFYKKRAKQLEKSIELKKEVDTTEIIDEEEMSPMPTKDEDTKLDKKI